MKYLFDEADSGCLQMYIDDEIRAFEEEHSYYRVCFNGRSGGYLVLYNADDNSSVLPNCLDYDTYEDFKEDVKGGWNGYRVSDFNRELRDTVELVREFDKLCDRLRDIVNEFSMRSFDVDKLEAAMSYFNDLYGDDLDNLGLMPPEREDGRVKLNDIALYDAFMHCFMNCFGDARNRVTTNEDRTYLWLKEN
jgi:hypothetical protein